MWGWGVEVTWYNNKVKVMPDTRYGTTKKYQYLFFPWKLPSGRFSRATFVCTADVRAQTDVPFVQSRPLTNAKSRGLVVLRGAFTATSSKKVEQCVGGHGVATLKCWCYVDDASATDVSSKYLFWRRGIPRDLDSKKAMQTQYCTHKNKPIGVAGCSGYAWEHSKAWRRSIIGAGS